MSKCRCFECGNDSGNWVIKKSTRKYDGEGYCFELEVETPYCEKCGASIYDHDTEQEIREKAHRRIREILDMSEVIEAIDRQAVIELIKNMPCERIRKGFWLKTCSPCGDGKVYECFNCGSDVRECEAESYHYCPWCGALTYGIKEVEDE